MPRRRILHLALATLAVALFAAACGGGEPSGETTAASGGTETVSPPTTGGETETGETETELPAETITLSVYFLRGEKIGVAHHQVPKTQAVGRAALEQLLAGPTDAEAEAGLHSEIPAGTELLDLAIEGGIATVDLSGEYDDGGGSLAMFTRLAQVVYTLTQFPTVEGVVFELDGELVEVFSGEGIVLEGPQTRGDYEDVTPAILVESPAVGNTVSSPLRVTGSANTFEATFLANVVDWDGKIVAEQVVTATCGTGCRGTFDVTIPFEWSGEPRGALIVLEQSAEDGSPINVVEIPLAFER